MLLFLKRAGLSLALLVSLGSPLPPAVAQAPTPAPAVSAPSALPSPYVIPLDLIPRIDCGDESGSGTYIDTNLVLTAAHVAEAGSCQVRGQPTEIAFVDHDHDFAVLRTVAASDTRVPLACVAPQNGGRYFAIGFALGSDFALQPVSGTGSTFRGPGPWHGTDIYRGNAYPGMSGGPVLDERGFLVGIVDAGPSNGLSIVLSRDLVGTYLCPAAVIQ